MSEPATDDSDEAIVRLVFRTLIASRWSRSRDWARVVVAFDVENNARRVVLREELAEELRNADLPRALIRECLFRRVGEGEVLTFVVADGAHFGTVAIFSKTGAARRR